MLDVASSLSEEEQLEVGVSNISLSEQPHNLSEQEQVEEQPVVEEAMAVIEEQPKLVVDEKEEEEKVAQEDEAVVEPPQPPSKDIFNLFSLAFICKSKDLSERRIRLEFGLVAEVYSLQRINPIKQCFLSRCVALEDNRERLMQL